MDSSDGWPARQADEEWLRDLLRRSARTVFAPIIGDLLRQPSTRAQAVRMRRLRRSAFLAARHRAESRGCAKLRVISGTDGRLHPQGPLHWSRPLAAGRHHSMTFDCTRRRRSGHIRA